MKRIVVAGSRNFDDYTVAKEYIDMCICRIKKEHTLVFVSGGCRGADMLGEHYAKENGYEIERYPADWKKHGRAAGPIRNRHMAEISDYVICFWDGKSAGTKSVIEYAKELGKPVKVKYIATNATVRRR